MKYQSCLKASISLFIFSIILFTSCVNRDSEKLAYGIKKELADFRKESISSIQYHLSFVIPESVEDKVIGESLITVDFNNKIDDLIFDFDVPEGHLTKLIINGEESQPEWVNNHIIIPSALLQLTDNKIKIDFIAGEQSLNRHEDYLYTLFVPARASTCFPLIDQPNIKASYELTLDIPEKWQAIANGQEIGVEHGASSKRITFQPTLDISSYLFAFAAGQFDIIERTTKYGQMRMFHRETDTTKLNQNLDAIFDWHLKSLDWLADYTAIDYPFPKFDFILLPSFQYGGMEHPGNVFYKASSLLLDESPTINEEISRGKLIAHETAHMWFGDLVTMSWFDDVWLKEVFANFMAAKIINPEFPTIDHELNFLLGHYPSAIALDRTEGTHAIAQELDDLYNAGSLYGSIIYQKAPIVMRKLEQQIGEDKLKEGLRKYLSTYSFGNATWDDLIAILGQVSGEDLTIWNKTWVKKAGMPVMITNVKASDNRLKRISLVQLNNSKESWQQNYLMELGNDTISTTRAINFKDRIFNIDGDSLFIPTYVFPNIAGDAYGYFKMGKGSKKHYLSEVNQVSSPTSRAAIWMSLYENMLHQNISSTVLLDAIMTALSQEKEPLIINYLNRITRAIFWNLLSDTQRLEYASRLEGLFFNLALSAEDSGLRSSFFRTFYQITSTQEGLSMLKDIWSGNMVPDQLIISENDEIKIACELAVKLNNDSILIEQIARISNVDRKEKLKFILPALSSEVEIRDSFFESLKNETNRQNEVWVLEALSYLHHPMRSKSALKYITPSLELLIEIKSTGDIFFPKRWLDNTFMGHQSVDAANEVRQFLYKNHNYPKDLKNKILQSADMLFRAESILTKMPTDS